MTNLEYVRKLQSALRFYAKEETWYGTTVYPDVLGDIGDDLEEIDGYYYPGRRAREILRCEK